MADILHDFTVKAPPERVFKAVTRPEDMDQWWTEKCAGEPSEGADYNLSFGPGYDWTAIVTRCVPDTEFELEMTDADPDWKGTRVGFQIEKKKSGTLVRFHHTGWTGITGHLRISSSCWAMYLRILRRYLEYGETVPYDLRLEV